MISKFILFAILLLNISFSYAAKISITTNPESPVMGEVFNVIFKISTENGTDPIISFDPKGLDVLGREETGIATKSTYINGNLTVERNITIVYEMVAAKAGSKYLRNITAEINGEVVKHSTYRIGVLAKARRPKDILAVAVVDKDSAFVGESILVRYYLYSKAQVSTTDIKKFPKLDKFLKRYHQERIRAERVQYEGEVYTRRVIYTAQLFAEQPGKYKIDPIALNVQYLSSGVNQNSFGNLGFGFRQQKRKTVRSKPILFEVKALPSENVPPSFTGLVGVHEFDLTLNKNKFLVNEPIEIKLKVKGKGALELYETPTIIENSSLEEFDSTNDFQVSADFSSSKTFNMTYLGRETFSAEARKIPFSYFNPATLAYETVNLDLGNIIIAGGSVKGKTQGSDKPEPEKQTITPKEVDKPFDMTPIYSLKNNYILQQRNINIFLGIILLVLLILKLKKFLDKYRIREIDLIERIRKKGLDYGKLHSLVSLLGHGSDMREIIINSKLKEKTKTNLLKQVEIGEKVYKDGSDKKKLKIKSSTLTEITKLLNEPNED